MGLTGVPLPGMAPLYSTLQDDLIWDTSQFGTWGDGRQWGFDFGAIHASSSSNKLNNVLERIQYGEQLA